MAKRGKVEANLHRLEALYESLKHTPALEVGVFGAKNSREQDAKSGPSNADIACAHEYGVPQHNLPSRSVLRTPLFDHKAQIMEAVKGKADMLIEKDGYKKVWSLVGVSAIQVIRGAFKTGGYGKWPSLKYATLLRKLKGSLKKRKGTLGRIYAGQVGEGILIDSHQLSAAYNWRFRMKF